MKTLSAFVKTRIAGFGFKGGGYYEHNMQYGVNRHRPIGNRNFGSWSVVQEVLLMVAALQERLENNMKKDTSTI